MNAANGIGVGMGPGQRTNNRIATTVSRGVDEAHAASPDDTARSFDQALARADAAEPTDGGQGGAGTRAPRAHQRPAHRPAKAQTQADEGPPAPKPPTPAAAETLANAVAWPTLQPGPTAPTAPSPSTAPPPRGDTTLALAALGRTAASAETAAPTLPGLDNGTLWQLQLPGGFGATTGAAGAGDTPVSTPTNTNIHTTTLWAQAAGAGWQLQLQAPAQQLLALPLQALQQRLAQRGHSLAAQPHGAASAIALNGTFFRHPTSALDTPEPEPWP